ncbi:MAG: FAD-dependent oxidoreductase [Candidatus Latescibacteria bacterium]|nr:FAD-dependent oxidoreductase [Candidatus Latescibacterota bacterium]
MTHDADVLVIGGGVIGICTAYYLTERGRTVTVIEKGEVCSGSSYGNAGLIVPSHSVPLAAPGMVSQGLRWMFNPESPFYIKPRLDRELFSWLWKFRGACNAGHVRRAMPVIRDLSLASLRLYEELTTRDDLQFGFERRGLLVVFRSAEHLKEGSEEVRRLQDIGLEVSVLNGDEVRALEPHVRMNTAGGVFYHQDAHLIPAKFVRELARSVEKKGAAIHPSTEVLGFETAGRRVATVKTTRGDFSAQEIVLASGTWSPGIARDLRINLPMQPAKGYSVTVKRPESSPVIPMVLAEARVGVTPMGETLRFAGTLELAGLDFSINRRRVQAILRSVPEYLPDLNPANLELIEIWRGLRPCTPDGLPYLGRARRYDNLTIAAGHAMIGVSLGPVTGNLVSQVVAGETPWIDLTMFSVERFD